ncbi:MAG TPA: hypothetical protein VE196_06400, partial [Pseudonocardiaceae bacterium]|nr:hypothetical protein [Pseudonocardiaceae bacterium]
MAKTPIGTHAVVLGASIAGLLTARVLAESYTRVTVIERDELPLDMDHRRGVPQGLHLHGLHAGGRQVLDELFPGFTEQVWQAGAEVGDTLSAIRWLLSGQRLRRADIGLPGLAASRPFLEGQVRQRVRALPSVRFLENCDVVGLVTDIGQRRITGVRIEQRHDDHTEEMMAADLIVDATGRGSRTVPGKRTVKIRMVNAYLPRLHAAAATDASLAAAFIRVLGMVDRPEGLLRPDRALRVLWAHLR